MRRKEYGAEVGWYDYSGTGGRLLDWDGASKETLGDTWHSTTSEPRWDGEWQYQKIENSWTAPDELADIEAYG